MVTVCVFLLQGSYGVVKLAYNEDDNTYYVSPSGHNAAFLSLVQKSKHQC